MLIISSKLEPNFRTGRWKDALYCLELLHPETQHAESPSPSLECAWKYRAPLTIIPPFMFHYYSWLPMILAAQLYLQANLIIIIFFFKHNLQARNNDQNSVHAVYNISLSKHKHQKTHYEVLHKLLSLQQEVTVNYYSFPNLMSTFKS